MSNELPAKFYSSKTRLVHTAINIGLAPALLYILKIWPWPPTMVHLVVFAVTTTIGVRFARMRWGIARLVIDDVGIHTNYGVFEKDKIVSLKPQFGSLQVVHNTDQGQKEDKIKLTWASSDDLKKIFELTNSYLS